MSDEPRQAWLVRRRQLEAQLTKSQLRSTSSGPRPFHRLLGHNAKMKWLFCVLGLYRRGADNAARPRLHRLDLWHRDLPAAFDGFTILFLSDLHLDVLSGALERAVELVSEVACDVAIFGGDYQSHRRPAPTEVAAKMVPLLRAIRAREGIFGVMGNHDGYDIVAPLQASGLSLLINETAVLSRDGQALTLVGCDDIHSFYDQAARHVLDAAKGFRIAVIHSPDYAFEAAAAGCSLYLAGHTHGGQICLPGGRPIVTALDRDRGLARGVWRVGTMLGYTSTGLGSGGLPVRFNCPPEVALITLRCAP